MLFCSVFGLPIRLLSLQTGEISSLWMLCVPGKTRKIMDFEPHKVVALGRKALSESNEATLLAENPQLFRADVDESLTSSSTSTGLTDVLLEEEKIVRSTRRLERRSKKRGVAKPKIMVQETTNPGRAGLKRTRDGYDPNNLIDLFLRRETSKRLTVKEELELIAHIQGLVRLDEVKSRLQTRLKREPTLGEWAAALRLSRRDLKMKIYHGHSSREKLIYATRYLVVHVAKQYLGRGLDLSDLLMEGSRGLMISFDKFKPQVGTRFASYAYWWIRRAVQKAIFNKSKIIRVPEREYHHLSKVAEAKRLCIQEGNYHPTQEEIAARAGMTVEKLDFLQVSMRSPISMQRPVWPNRNITFQGTTFEELFAEIADDNSMETSDIDDTYALAYNSKYMEVPTFRFCLEENSADTAIETQDITNIYKRPWLLNVEIPRCWIYLEEITADPRIEELDISAAKEFMRQHVLNLLSILTPRERKVIGLRYGIEGDVNRPQPLSEIGVTLGITRERVRQLESRALSKMKGRISSQQLRAYKYLVTW